MCRYYKFNYSKLKKFLSGGGSFLMQLQQVVHRQFLTKSLANGMNEMLYHDNARNCAQIEKSSNNPRAGM